MDALTVLLCAMDASRDARMKAVRILDDQRVLRIEALLQESLGYAHGDLSWIPEHWYSPLPPGPIESGYDQVRKADGTPATLQWTRLRNGPVSSYWTRVLTKPPAGLLHVENSHALGTHQDSPPPKMLGIMTESDLPRPKPDTTSESPQSHRERKV